MLMDLYATEREKAIANSVYPLAADRRHGLKVVVVGHKKSGKSTMIDSFRRCTANEEPNARVKHNNVLPPFEVNIAIFPEPVETIIYDTSSRDQDSDVKKRLKEAEVVILTFNANEYHFKNLRVWFDCFRNEKVTVPILVVGCNSGYDDKKILNRIQDHIKENFDLEEDFAVLDVIRETVFCSAESPDLIKNCFFRAQREVLFPAKPLMDRATMKPKQLFLDALHNIFLVSDGDKDGALSYKEYNKFMVKCFMTDVHELDYLDLILIKLNKTGFTNGKGITEMGFIDLMSSFQRIETTWTVLRKFGYDDNLLLH